MQGAAEPDLGNARRERSASARRPEIRCLTSVRFVAALQVVLFHTLFELGGKPPIQAFPRALLGLFTQGDAAVSLFFVLSGFIIAYTYIDDEGALRGTPSRFWRARFARIYPLYFLGFVIDAPRVISFFLGSTTSLEIATVKIGIAGSAYLALVQSWFPRVTNTWNTPGWSLSTEAFFYAVFPALHALTQRWPLRRLVGIGIAIWALPIAAYPLVARLHPLDVNAASFQTFWRSFPPLRLPEFALGVVAGRLLLSGQLATRMTALRRAGLLALLLLLVLQVCAAVWAASAVDMSLRAPLFAVVILASAADALRAPRWLNGSALVALGRASYAVYILHQPLKTVFLAVARRAGLNSPSLALLIAYLFCLELICVGLFQWFEDPLRRLIARVPTPSRRQ